MRKTTDASSFRTLFMLGLIAGLSISACVARDAGADESWVRRSSNDDAAGIHWSTATVRPTRSSDARARGDDEDDSAHLGRSTRRTHPPQTIPCEHAFVSLGIRWRDSASSALARIDVRGSRDGATWGDWIRVEIDHDMTIAGSGEFFSRLLHLGAETRAIQYVIQPDASDNANIEEIEFIFIDPGPTPLSLAGESAPRSSLALEALVDPPPITSRVAWGCPDGQESPNWPPQYTAVSHFIVHHTATTNAATDWAAEVRSIWVYHAVTRGWQDIGYNFLIDPDGVIYEGRAGGPGVKGAHFSCQNSNTMGVALLGDFQASPPDLAALVSLEHLLAWRAEALGLDPLGESLHPGADLVLDSISGHRDGNDSLYTCSTTICPGDLLYDALAATRNGVAALLADEVAAVPGMSPALRLALGVMLWLGGSLAVARRFALRGRRASQHVD